MATSSHLNGFDFGHEFGPLRFGGLVELDLQGDVVQHHFPHVVGLRALEPVHLHVPRHATPSKNGMQVWFTAGTLLLQGTFPHARTHTLGRRHCPRPTSFSFSFLPHLFLLISLSVPLTSPRSFPVTALSKSLRVTTSSSAVFSAAVAAGILASVAGAPAVSWSLASAAVLPSTSPRAVK